MTKQLPPKPSLEHLQKEAKSLKKSFDKQNPEVCSILKNLNKFSKSTPKEILKSSIGLQEIQHALSIEYGFKSWKEISDYCQSFTTKNKSGVNIKNLKWTPLWTSLIGCTKGCTDYLGLDHSLEWIFGGSGYAFMINSSDVLCPSHPTAWNREPYFKLTKNLGFNTEQIFTFQTQDEFKEKQKSVWDLTKKTLNNQHAIIMWEMDVPEYYIITGYDEKGYYYTGPLADKHKGPKPWQEIGTEICLEALILKQSKEADDRTVIKDVFQYALELTKEPEKWTFEGRETGLNGYKNWIQSIKKTADGPHSGHALAYNSKVWAECRKYCTAFLKEVKKRLKDDLPENFNCLIQSYNQVAKHLETVSQLFPFNGKVWDINVRDPQLQKDAIKHIKKAKQYEEEGLEKIEEIVKIL